MRRLVFLITLFAGVCADISVPETGKPDLRRVVGLAGENGIVAFRGDTISIFSDKNIHLQNVNGDGWKMQEKISGAVSLQIKTLQWKRVEQNLDVSAAYGPALCDPLNQVDIASTLGRLPLALPKGAKVKAIRKFGGLAIAVYSISGSTVTYDVRLALLQLTTSGDYLLIKSDIATEAGTYCGMQETDSHHIFLLADEPSGSSDFLAVYVYAVVASGPNDKS